MIQRSKHNGSVWDAELAGVGDVQLHRKTLYRHTARGEFVSAEQKEMAASLVLQRSIQGVVQTRQIIVSHVGCRAGGNADFWSTV